MIEAVVAEADRKGQHEKKVFYGRYGNVGREIANPEECERYHAQM